MEFHEKLQKLRKERGITQEELAAALFVSRAAISKWESGRGYPNIESLKQLSSFFCVSVDELIRSEDVIALAEKEKQASIHQYTCLVCSIVDALLGVLLILPVFATGEAAHASGAVFALLKNALWIKIIFIGVISLTAINGICGIVLHSLDKPLWSRCVLRIGMVMTLLGTMTFIASRQPYAAMLFLIVLVVKGWLNVKVR